MSNKTTNKLFILIIAAILFPTVSMADSQVNAGETVFNKSCSRCHGIKGSGTESGPPLVNKIYEPGHHSDMSFHFAVNRGVRAHHWKFGNMPRIKGVSSKEVDQIIQYIRGLQREAGII